MKTYLTRFLAIVALFLGFQAQSSHAQVIVNISDVANNVAQAYDGGGAFVTGPNPLSLGNINTLPTRTRGIIKFDIAQFAGMTITNADFNFNVQYFNNTEGFTLPFQIDVYSLDYDKTAAAFVVGDLFAPEVTSRGSFDVSAAGLASWDATVALQGAVDAGYDYLSLKFINSTVQLGPFGDAAYIGLNTAGNALNLSVEAVPEPTVLGLLGLSLVALAGRRTSRWGKE